MDCMMKSIITIIHLNIGNQMKVKLLAENIGAEITDISIDSLDESQINEIKQAWLKHKVLVFRDQDISIKSHIEFGKLFGDLEIHPFADNHEDYPEVIVLEAGGFLASTNAHFFLELQNTSQISLFASTSELLALEIHVRIDG